MNEGALGKEYRDGEVICRQGEPAGQMYIVQSGRVLVVREEQGSQFVIRELTEGDVFGELAVLERQPRSATVRASGTARVLTLDTQAFLRRVHEDPSLAYRMLLTMSQWIRSLTDELARRQSQR